MLYLLFLLISLLLFVNISCFAVFHQRKPLNSSDPDPNPCRPGKHALSLSLPRGSLLTSKLVWR